jgi:hypothetical protein
MGHSVKFARLIVGGCVLAALLADCRIAAAQEPPPIPLFVVDLHGTVLSFPDDPLLGLSRNVTQAELPGVGLGGDIAVHVYPFSVGPVTFGLGGRLMTSRARRNPPASTEMRQVTERFTYLGPQLSLNFGTGTGWSYLSGGIAGSKWSVVPEGTPPLPPDEERLKTIDYGGGARWFARPHLAFSFDLRFYAINPSSPAPGLVGGPRTTLFVVGVGISVK